MIFKTVFKSCPNVTFSESSVTRIVRGSENSFFIVAILISYRVCLHGHQHEHIGNFSVMTLIELVKYVFFRSGFTISPYIFLFISVACTPVLYSCFRLSYGRGILQNESQNTFLSHPRFITLRAHVVNIRMSTSEQSCFSIFITIVI
jgi:hypothetical protein